MAVSEPTRPLSMELANAMIEAIPSPTVLLDLAATITFANRVAHTMLGSDQQTLVGQLFLDTLDPGSVVKARAMLAAAQRGPTAAFELNQCIDGQAVVTVSYQASPILKPNGQREGTMLLGQSLAPLVASTERLLALNRRIEALFSIASSASRSLDLEHLLADTLHITSSELDIQAAAVFLREQATPNKLALAAQLGFRNFAGDAAVEWVERLRATGERSGDVIVLEGEHHDLGLHPEQVPGALNPFWKIVIAPIRADNRLIGRLVLLTDRYRALNDGELEALQAVGDILGPPIANARLFGTLNERTGQLQSVLDGIDSGVVLADTNGIVRYANHRLGELLHIDVDVWPGQPLANVWPTSLQRSERSQQLFDGELWEIAGSSPLILRRLSHEVIHSNGMLLGTIDVYSDVTQAQQINQLKDEFIAAAAHDLKTPVTAIKGYTQIALRLASRGQSERVGQQLELVNALSDELTYHMDTLLDVSRLQAGRLELDVTRSQLSKILDRTTHHIMMLPQRHIQFTVDTPEQSVEVVWDGPRIERVLMNLLGNAIKYSPRNGIVLFRARVLPDAAVVELTVADQGIGIPPEERELVFERFYRSQQAISEGYKGTGLGLYISRQLVQLHGGEIFIADQAADQPGTTVVVRLPQFAETLASETP